MSPWFVSLVISASLFAQPDADKDTPSPELQIRGAIQQLAKRDFATRDQAYRFLWRQGLKAEPALRHALKNANGETRLRVRQLLRDFDYGILPGIDARVAERLRQYRDGDALEREIAFLQLLEGKHFDVVERLIRQEANATVRLQLLERLFGHPAAVEQFTKLAHVKRLVVAVAADQEESWRRLATIRLMFASKMLERFAKDDRLGTLLKLLRDEKEAVYRRQMLQAVFQTPANVESLVKAGKLSFLLDALKAEPDTRQRGDFLALIQVNGAAAEMLVANKQLAVLMDFVEEEIHADKRHQVLARLLYAPAIVKALVGNNGLDGVMRLVQREKNATNRGRLLASILASPAFRSVMPREKLAEATVAIAKKEKDAKTRHEFLETLLANSSVIYAFSNEQSLKAIWDLIKSDADTAWQPKAVAMLLRSSYAYRLLQNKEEATWVLKLVRDTKSQATREQLLSYLLGNYQAHDSLLKDGQFEALLGLATELPQNSRGRIVGSFLASRAVAQYLTSSKRLDVLVELPRDEKHELTRQAYLQGIFRNYTAMPELMKGGHYRTFRNLIDEDVDAVRRATLFGDFLMARSVTDELKKQGDMNDLLEHANATNKEVRKQFLPRLFRNRSAVGLLVDEGHYEHLVSIAKENKGEFLDELLSVPKVVEYLTENKKLNVLFEFVAEAAADNTRRNMLRGMIYNQQLMKKLLEAGHFDPIFKLVRAEKDVNWRSSLLGPALSSPEILRHLAASKKLFLVFDIIRDEPQARVRTQIISQLAGRSDAITIVVENDQLQTLLRTIKKHTTARTQGELLGRVLTSTKTLDKLVKDNQQALLLSFAEDADRESAEAFVTRLFAYRKAIDILVDSGHYDALFRLATVGGNAKASASRISQLFSNSKALQQLIGRQQIGTLIQLAKNAEDAETRRTYLGSFCRNEALVRQLIKEELFVDLLEICRADPDTKTQQRHLATLLLSGKATDELKRLGQLEAILQAALDETDTTVQRTWLSGLLTRSEAVNALIKHGHFARVLGVAEKKLTGNTLSSIFQSLLSHPQAVNYFADNDRIEVLWKLLDDARHPSQRPYLVSRFASSDRLMKLIAEKGQLDRLLKEVRNSSSASYRRSLENRILFSSGTLEGLAAKGTLSIVFEHTKKEGDEATRRQCLQAFAYRPANRKHLAESAVAEQFVALIKQEDERYRTGYAMQLLNDSYLRRKWVESGKVEVLEEIISLVPQESRRTTYRQQLLFSPSGVFGNLLRRGEVEEAERLALGDEGDAGLSAYVTLQMIRNQITERITTVQERFEAAGESPDARLLVYLHRAAGNDSAAREVAEKLDDPRLLRPLYVEQHAWREAALLEAKSHQPAPVAASTYFVDTEESFRIEQLGLLAAYYRHAGLQEDVDSTVKAILEFAESHQDNKDLVWFAAEALLLNGRFDEGIELTTTAKIEKAFTLLTFRHEYARALALVGLENAVVPDRKWYDELPCEGRSEQETKQRRFDFALRLARIQKHLGRDDNAEQILSVVNEFVGSVPATGSSPQRSYFQEKLAAALYHMGFLERSWAVAAETTNVNSTYAPNVLNLIYGTREIEADAWWVFFRDKFPEESLTSCFNRVHLALNPAHDEAEGAYTVTVREAIAFAPTLRSVSQRDAFWKGIGLTSRIRGHRAEAIECLQHAAVSIPDAARTVADLRAELGQWPEAAQSYRALWEKDHEQLGALYLAGDALERAGETEQGAAWKQEANLLAIRSRTRHTMSVDLANRGLTEEAVAQWELLIKTAPLESWELNDAARRLGDYCVSTEPQRAAELWERYLLGDLRPCFWFLKDESYLRMPFVIQKARAAQAIQDGQLDALRDALATATKAAPSDTRLAEELVPVLEAAGHQAEADRLAAVLIDHYRGRSKAYPKSAYFHNNLAWVAARCHRELDLAMEHATQATLLEPKNGSYIDTLAEVHFQLGDREAAIRESERALRQSPFDRSLRQQLERFRNEVIPQRHDDI